MKKLIFGIALLAITMSSCDQFQTDVERKPLQNESRVYEVQGIKVFIMSEPLLEYEVIQNDFSLDGYVSDVAGETKNGKIGDVLGGMISRSIERADMSKMIGELVSKTKEAYPEAEGVIVSNSMVQCRVIKFK